MADVEVWGVELRGGRVESLSVRFKGTEARVVDRATALAWLAGGHSLVLHTGSPHHPHRHGSLERVEVGGEAFIRSDTLPEASDAVHMPRATAH